MVCKMILTLMFLSNFWTKISQVICVFVHKDSVVRYLRCCLILSQFFPVYFFSLYGSWISPTLSQGEGVLIVGDIIW